MLLAELPSALKWRARGAILLMRRNKFLDAEMIYLCAGDFENTIRRRARPDKNLPSLPEIETRELSR